MSVEYTFYLRYEPKLEALLDSDDDANEWWANELRRDDDGSWTFGAMRLSVARYRPRPGDPLRDRTYREEIHWVIDADGRHGTLYDEWTAMVDVICRRWKGVLYSSQQDDFTGPEERPRPITCEELAALIGKAAGDERIMRRLQQGGPYIGNKSFGDHMMELLVDHARAGAPLDPWRWTITQRTYDVPALARAEARKKLAACGPLAAAIVEQWESRRREHAEMNRRIAEEHARNAPRNAAMIEKRRRAGEIYAGIPEDVAALAKSDMAEAVAAYARLYELDPARARQVVVANAKVGGNATRGRKK